MSSITAFQSQVLFVTILLVFFWNAACVRGIAKTFYFHTQGGNSNAAWGVCASYGATLVKIRNQREYDAFLELAAAQPEFVWSPYWIGLFRTKDNQFSWECSDQLGSTYTNWGETQPLPFDSLQCVEVRADKLWYTASCYNSYKFICQRKTGSCVYIDDAPFTTFSVTSRLATQSVNTVSECQRMCENFNSGESCFYVLYRTNGECSLLESKPTIISAFGEYSGYSRTCYSGERRTEQVSHVRGSPEPPIEWCMAPPLTLANQPRSAPRDQTTEATPDETTTSSDKTTAFADKTTVVPSVETTFSFQDETTVASADETTATSTDKTTIVSPDKTTATPPYETTTLPDTTTVVSPDKTTVVSLEETTVISRDFTTTGAQRTADDDISVTRIQTSTQSETTLQYSGIQSEETSVNTNTAGVTEVDRSTTAISSTQLVNLVTVTSQDSTLTSTVPNVLSTMANSTPEASTVRTSTTMKTPSLFSTLSAKPNVASSSDSETITREVRTSETSDSSTANLTYTAPDISLKNTKSTFLPLLETTQNNCYCPCAMSYSAEEKEQFIQVVLDELSMDRKVISAYVRTLTSAPDPRPSAKAVGCTGLVMLVTIIVIIVLFDFTTLFRDCKTIKESINTLFHGKSSMGLNT